jgi:hypothetical protein
MRRLVGGLPATWVSKKGVMPDQVRHDGVGWIFLGWLYNRN